MQIGVVYPQIDLPCDAGAVRAYVEGVEALGFAHLLVYEHVLGADRAVHEGWSMPYDVDTPFHEPFVLLGFLASFSRLEFVTGVVVAPQRQTALLAKQAACVDVLTGGGRFRLGLGVGWNRVEYEALGQDFGTRGAREEEQIGLLRRLWSERSVTFDGRFDRITGAGLCPRPVDGSIPVWLGGASDPAYRRIGRLADGWFPQVPPDERLDHALATVAEAAAEAGRDGAGIAMEARVEWSRGGLEKVADHAARWRQAGASHLSVDTMKSGLGSVEEHLDALQRVAEVLLPQR